MDALGKARVLLAMGDLEQAAFERFYRGIGGIISHGWVSAPIFMELWTSHLAFPILGFFIYRMRLL